MSTIIIEREAPPLTQDPLAKWIVKTLSSILQALSALVSLDANLRETRTLVAERAVNFFGAVVTDTTVQQLREVFPECLTQNFTTAFIAFDVASGAGRYRSDGPFPDPAGAPTDGLPIPTGGYTLTITGADNIRDFAVIAETGSTLNMSIQFYK